MKRGKDPRTSKHRIPYGPGRDFDFPSMEKIDYEIIPVGDDALHDNPSYRYNYWCSWLRTLIIFLLFVSYVIFVGAVIYVLVVIILIGNFWTLVGDPTLVTGYNVLINGNTTVNGIFSVNGKLYVNGVDITTEFSNTTILQETVASQGTAIANIQGVDAAQNSSIANLQNTTAYQGQIIALRGQQIQQIQEVIGLNQTFLQFFEQLVYFQSLLNNNTLYLIMEDIVVLNASVITLQQSSLSQQSQLTILQNNVTIQGEYITVLFLNVSSLFSLFTALQNTVTIQGINITSLFQITTTNSNAISILQTNVTSQSSAISTIQSELTTINNTVNTLSAPTPSTNSLYVDGINGLDTNTGQITSPLKTIQAAINKIPKLTTYSSFTNPLFYSYVINIEPGIYASEPNNTITIGDGLTYTPAPIITFVMYGVRIMANIIYNSNGNITISGTPLQQTQFLLHAHNLKSDNSGSTPITGVNGTVTVNGFGSNTVVIEVVKTAVSGTFTAVGTGAGITCRLYISNAYMQNIMSSGTSTIALYAEHSPPDLKYGLGSLIGNIALTQLNGVMFASAASLSGNAGGGTWYNTQFAAGSTSTNSGNITTDANSLVSYTAAFLGSLGSYSFTFSDGATGIAYSPTNPSIWSPVPATIQAALDTLAINQFKQVSVLISSAQLLALSTTPVLLIPAPGTGNFIYPTSYNMQYHYGGTAYSSPAHTNDCYFTYGSTTSPSNTNTAMLYNWASATSGIIEATASATFIGFCGDSFTLYTTVNNAGLYFYAPNALTLGNGYLTIVINYSIRSLP